MHFFNTLGQYHGLKSNDIRARLSIFFSSSLSFLGVQSLVTIFFHFWLLSNGPVWVVQLMKERLEVLLVA